MPVDPRRVWHLHEHNLWRAEFGTRQRVGVASHIAGHVANHFASYVAS
jgi:hypothetical protein